MANGFSFLDCVMNFYILVFTCLVINKIRDNYAKTATPSASFAYILRQAPNHKLSNELMSNLLWPKDVKFPYGLSKGITVASPTSDAEDEKAEDD